LSPGASSQIPDRVHDLLVAATADASEKASQYLRGVVVRQGSVYEAAEAFVEFCLTRMESVEITEYGAGDALDIIVEIVEGEPDPSEVLADNDALVMNCVDVVRKHAAFLLDLARTSGDELVVYGAIELLNMTEMRGEAIQRLAQEMASRSLRSRSEWIHRSFVSMLDSLRVL
jgi:hypothetical protein